MKVSSSALLASAAASLAAAANFTQVALDEPLNWVVGTYLWPAELIAGYNALVDGTDYTDETWDAYVLAACESYTACTSSISWQGMLLLLCHNLFRSVCDIDPSICLFVGTNSGSTGGRSVAYSFEYLPINNANIDD